VRLCDDAVAYSKNRTRTYRYYTCTHAQKKGWAICLPSRSGRTIEQFVVDQIRDIGRDPTLRNEVLAQVRRKEAEHRAELLAEAAVLERDLRCWHDDLRRASGNLQQGERGQRWRGCRTCTSGSGMPNRSSERCGRASKRWIAPPLTKQGRHGAGELRADLANVDTEGTRQSLHQLIERVDYDGARGNVSMTFHPIGIQALVDQLTKK